jgi:DNA-directed RNA polymerase subunit RPC12/RpoP
MEAKKYLCNQCQELFDLIEPGNSVATRCPRCSSGDIQELIACNLENGPPPWEYVCQQCGGRFLIKAPRGPSEEKEIRCPRCESRNVKWLATASQVCPPGG